MLTRKYLVSTTSAKCNIIFYKHTHRAQKRILVNIPIGFYEAIPAQQYELFTVSAYFHAYSKDSSNCE